MHRSMMWILAGTAALLLVGGLLAPASLLGQEESGAPGPAPDEEQRPAPEAAAAEAPPEADPDVPRMKPKATGRPLLPGSTLPPANLRFVRDHWTPWSPPDPESFPPDATLHIIVPGDTLWDLADLAYGNPYLWPQIWNVNRYILDSHWIYPGDPLLLPARPTVVSEVVPQGAEAAPPPAAPDALPEETIQEPLTAEASGQEAADPGFKQAPPSPPSRPATASPYAARTAPMPRPIVDDSDIRCSGFIARKEERPEFFIANQEEEGKVGLSEGDIVYLNRGRDNGHLEPGTEYSIVVRQADVDHPVTHRRLGTYYRRVGTARVLQAFEKTGVAVIAMACDEIRTGYDLVPLKVTTFPVTAPPPFERYEVTETGKPVGYVVRIRDGVDVAGAGDIVTIDLGYADDLEPGDYLTVFLHSRPIDRGHAVEYDFTWQNQHYTKPPLRVDRRNHFPPKIIGQLIVVSAEKHTATAKVIQSVREIEVGSLVEIY